MLIRILSRGTQTYIEAAVAQWLRCCATNRKVSGSILAGVIVENYVLYRVKKKDNILHTKKKKTGQMYLSHPVHELPLKTHY